MFIGGSVGSGVLPVPGFNWDVPKGVKSIDLTLVGGGGGGGSAMSCDNKFIGIVNTQSFVCGGGSGCTGGKSTTSIPVQEKTRLFIAAGIGGGGKGGSMSGGATNPGQDGSSTRVMINNRTVYNANGGGGGGVAQYSGPGIAKGCSNPPNGGIAGKDGEKIEGGINTTAYGGVGPLIDSENFGSGGHGGNHIYDPSYGTGWGDGKNGGYGYVRITW
jgi:hypothetical protein